MSHNPLKQYFRRPSIYLKLPSEGKGYAPNSIDLPENNELPIYPMTAIDELTAKTPDALYNGQAVVDIIKSCVPNIKDPWTLLSIDLDAILIAIKSASSGDSLEIDTSCPKCKEVSTYNISLVGLLSTLKVGDYSKALELGDLKIKFKPLTYKEINEAALGKFEVEKTFVVLNNASDEDKIKISKELLEKITLLTMELLSKTIIEIETPTVTVDSEEFILDFLKNCDRNIFNNIRDYNTELKSSSELKPLDIKCTACGNEYSQPFTLNPSDFFD